MSQNYLSVATTPLPPSRYSTEIFKKVNPSRLNSTLPLQTKPSTYHTVVWQRVLAPSLWARSGRRLVGSCRFSSKLHEQSKLEVQPSLEAKPLWAIHTPVPVWDQWLKPPAYSHPLPSSLPPSLFPLSFPLLSHKYRLLTLPNTWYLLIKSPFQVGLVTEKISPGLMVGSRMRVKTKMFCTYSTKDAPVVSSYLGVNV